METDKIEAAVTSDSDGFEDSDTGNLSDIVVGGLALIVILGSLVAFAIAFEAENPDERLILLVSGVVGAAIGWPTGIILSPYNRREVTSFRDISRTIYGVVAGYAVAKVDPIISAAVERASAGDVSVLISASFAVGVAAFLAVATFTYVSRRYWSPSGQVGSQRAGSQAGTAVAAQD